MWRWDEGQLRRGRERVKEQEDAEGVRKQWTSTCERWL